MDFELLQSEMIFQGRAFSVRRDQLRLPDGGQQWLEIVEHRPAVAMIPIEEDGTVWLIRQYRHAAGGILLELPAGVLEEDETPEAGAHRELREEIGMSAGQLIWLGEFFLAPGYSMEFMYVYLARQLRSDPLPGDEGEFLSVEKVSILQAYELAEAGQIRDAKSLGALLLARPRLKELGLV